MRQFYFTFLMFFLFVFAEAQIVTIPDVNFKNALIEDNVDVNNNGEIEVSEASQVINMYVSYEGILDLTGIEAFINLENLSCSGNNLTSLDLSNNIDLANLYCSSNDISSILFNPSTNLYRLLANNNNLNILDIANHTNLKELDVTANNLSNLSVANLTNLEKLRVSQNNLMSLNIANSSALEDLYMSDNQVENIDLSNKPNLDTINCDNNPITSLDLSECPSLTFLYCSSTSITSLDFTQNPDVSFITCSNSSLQELLLNNNPSLQRLICDNNQLIELVIEGVHSLRHLTCNDNLLSKLVVKDLEVPLVMNAQNNQNLFCVEVDDPNIIYDNNSIYIDPQTTLNTNCSSDEDSDGIDNDTDQCPNTNLGDTVDSNGCATNQNGDDDNDGVVNGIDKCPDTQTGEAVNYFGCPLSEIINFLDGDFKNRFVHNFSIDSNSDGIPDMFADLNDDDDIQYSEAEMISALVLKGVVGEDNGSMTNLEGLQHFVNLTRLDFRSFYFNLSSVTDPSNFSFTALTNLEFLHFNANINNSDNLDLSGLSNLNELILNIRPLGIEDFGDHNPETFVNLNLENCSSLETFDYSNSFLNIDFCQVPSIRTLYCQYLEGGEPEDYLFDFSCLVNLETLRIDENTINTLILKNGSVLTDLQLNLGIYNYPDFICIDDLPGEESILSELIGPNTVVNSYCSFVPGGEYYTVSGETRFDVNANGCDGSDELYPFIKVNLTTDTGISTFISDVNGLYSIPLQSGNYALTPVLENLDYFTITPNSVSIDIIDSEVNQDFCIVADGEALDLEILLIPLSQARPGFDTDYKLIFKNKGNQSASGSIVLNFQDEFMDFMTSNPNVNTQVTNSLTWNYLDLLPFETREINFTMILNTPTDANFPLNGDDILEFITSITPNDSDETPNDNIFSLNQTVVNSFDPNDKTCLEGDIIGEAMVGEYVHYMIRFENTGTASAINVVVKDDIDLSKFDINTLILLDASHDFVTRIQNTNEVEFIFENINLPFDDANNDGYVTFKIKTLQTLTVGETFSNDAEIYFDFNAPIITNDFTTTVEDNLSIDNPNFRDSVKLYPNPVNDVLTISSEVNIEKASIYDINGRLLQNIVFCGNETQRTIDLHKLAIGVYIFKLSSENGELTQKVIKE